MNARLKESPIAHPVPFEVAVSAGDSDLRIGIFKLEIELGIAGIEHLNKQGQLNQVPFAMRDYAGLQQDWYW